MVRSKKVKTQIVYMLATMKKGGWGREMGGVSRAIKILAEDEENASWSVDLNLHRAACECALRIISAVIHSLGDDVQVEKDVKEVAPHIEGWPTV